MIALPLKITGPLAGIIPCLK